MSLRDLIPVPESLRGADTLTRVFEAIERVEAVGAILGAEFDMIRDERRKMAALLDRLEAYEARYRPCGCADPDEAVSVCAGLFCRDCGGVWR